jgi:hypothetical protein
MKMKKLFVLFALTAALAATASAQDFSKLPKGKWLDPAWNAVWEFGADGIRLLGADGAVIFDFKDKMADFKVEPSMSEVVVSFSSAETDRAYRFVKKTTNLEMEMEINPGWTGEDYKVAMKLNK